MPSSVRRLVHLDHERLGRLLRRACAAGPSRERWRSEFLGLLRAHCEAERSVLLGGVPDEGEALRDTVRAEIAADTALDRLADRLDAAGPPDQATTDLQKQLAVMLEQHAHRWSEHVLDPLEQTVPRGTMRRLGGGYESRRDEMLSGSGIAQPPPRRLDLSRAELYEMARRAGIEGRSSMTRGELIAALQQRD